MASRPPACAFRSIVGLTAALAFADVDDLRKQLTGAVIEPGEQGYELARVPAIAQFAHIRPRAVVRCESIEDVARTLVFARRSNVHIVPRGGGHCFAGRSSTSGIILDLTPLQAISVSGGLVTIGAGARLASVYDALAEQNLALPAGCGATVGIAGLTLGGGLGVLGRTYGLTCDRLRAAQVVLPDGRVVECSEDREPELSWALRGAGGGQFGVVTSFVFEPVPEPAAAKFILTWPPANAVKVIAAWQEWSPDAPDSVHASLKITSAGVLMFGVVLDQNSIGQDSIVDQLGVPPASATWTRMPFRDMKRSFAHLDAMTDEPTISKSEFFRRPLPTDVLADLLAGQVRSPHRELAFTPMGGVYNRVEADATAFVHRRERFLLEHVTVRSDREWARTSWALAHPWASDRVYPNFPDPDLANWCEAYHGENYKRLAQLKHHYDPDRLLDFHQCV